MKITSNNTSGEILIITYLRGIASLGVCMIHLNMFSGYSGNEVSNYIIDKGQLGVQVFFIISGFILPFSLYKKKYEIHHFFNFLIKRMIRIDPPFWLFVLIYALFANDKLIEIKNVLLNFFYLVPCFKNAYWYSNVFWTLSIEFQFYLILGLIFPLLVRLKIIYQLVLLLVIFQIILFSNFGYERDFIIDNLIFFILGYICFLNYIKKISLKYSLFILFILCFELSVVRANRFGIISAITIFSILVLKPIDFKPLKFLGKISYSLYLSHILIGSVTINLISQFNPDPLLSLFTSLLASILFSTLYYIIIEKPSMRLSKNITYVNRIDLVKR